MGALDIFRSDAFSVRSLTNAINKVPPSFSYLGDIEGLFEKVSCSTTTTMVEERNGQIALVGNSPRGTKGETLPRDQRKMRAFVVNHKQLNDEIKADQIQNQRLFGSEIEFETAQTVMNDKLVMMARSIETTIEWMRLGAVKGQVLDADGSVLHDMFEEFGQTKRTKSLKASVSTDDGSIKKFCSEVIRSTRKKLGDTKINGFHLLCGDAIFDAIENSAEIKNANKWRNNSDFLVDSHAFRYFEFGGIRFVNYVAWVGDKDFIDPEKAHLLPICEDAIFSEIYGPGDYMETVNTPGLKYYAKQEVQRMDKGIDVEAQSNPLVLCTRPGALLEVTLESTT